MNAPPGINVFNGEYRFLSNFYGCTVTLDGEVYVSVEHAFQAAKVEKDATYRAYIPNHGYTERRWRQKIGGAGSAAKARQYGKASDVPLRDGWDAMRVSVMRSLLEQKFAPGSPLATRLRETGSEPLTEGNTWHDQFWGQCYCRVHQWRGENHLGRLLMEVRRGLR